MRVVSVILTVVVILSALACAGSEPSPIPTSTPYPSPTPTLKPTATSNLSATIEAAIAATIEAEASIESTVDARIQATQEAEDNINATVEARVAATLASPTATSATKRPTKPSPPRAVTATTAPTAVPRPTATSAPTAVPRPTAAPAPAAVPRPTAAPAPAAVPRPTLNPSERLTLKQYADRFAGGPGAIYAGDLSQLAGPAPSYDLGDDNGNVPLYALEQNRWIYESDYYQSLLQKANLGNPTPLTSRGERIEIQYACINLTLLPCRLIDQYWAPNLEQRTNGQIRLRVASFPELGIAGPDTLRLLSDGTLEMANLYSGYVAGELPIHEVQTLWGMYPDRETAFQSSADALTGLDATLSEATHGGVVVNHNWFTRNDQFIFTSQPLRSLADFYDLKTRSHSASLSDWLDGMGNDPRFVSFGEVYSALERGILDAAVTGSFPAFSQHWYEVSSYMNGPLISFLPTSNLINVNLWYQIPADLQQILIEEGAKSELEQLRLASIQNLMGVQKNVDAGMELVEFSPEMKRHSFNVAVMQHVIPGWLDRLDYPGSGNDAVTLFNDSVGPYVGLHIKPDGSVVKVPITRGPHAGKTMEQVLAE